MKRSMWPVRCSSTSRPRLALVDRAAEGVQIGIGEHATAVVSQTHAGIVQPVHARHVTHVVTHRHIAHREQRPRIKRRHLGLYSPCGASVPRA